MPQIVSSNVLRPRSTEDQLGYATLAKDAGLLMVLNNERLVRQVAADDSAVLATGDSVIVGSNIAGAIGTYRTSSERMRFSRGIGKLDICGRAVPSTYGPAYNDAFCKILDFV